MKNKNFNREKSSRIITTRGITDQETEKKREEEREKGRERVLKLERKVEKGRIQERRH